EALVGGQLVRRFAGAGRGLFDRVQGVDPRFHLSPCLPKADRPFARIGTLRTLALAGCGAPQESSSMAWFTYWPAEGPDVLDGRVKAALAAGGPVADFRTQPVAVTRKNFDTGAAAVPRLKEPLKSVETRTLPQFKIRLYMPEGRGPFPALVFFHGGGWVLGDLESHDDVCRTIASRTPAVVVSVDYRLAPEWTFPVPLDDCEAGLRWTVEHAAE